MNLRFLLDDIVPRLATVPEVRAVVLGGSYATQSQQKYSDVDLGIYYEGDLDTARIRAIAQTLNDFPNPVVTEVGEWGTWVNGGAWLTINGRRVDFLYRDMGFVSNIINDCRVGIIESDFYQQPAFGFHNYMYCAEVKFSKALYDPRRHFQRLKAKLDEFPEGLKKAIINKFLRDAELTLSYCTQLAMRGDRLLLVGGLTRIANDLVQVLYALNETFFLSEKRSGIDVQGFPAKPPDFTSRLEQAIDDVRGSPDNLLEPVGSLATIVADVTALCGSLFAAGIGDQLPRSMAHDLGILVSQLP